MEAIRLHALGREQRMKQRFEAQFDHNTPANSTEYDKSSSLLAAGDGFPDEKRIFLSLTERAAAAGLLSSAEGERLKGEVLSLLEGQCRRYTREQSGSLRNETAGELLQGIFYLLGVWLEGQTISGGAALLRRIPLEEGYRQGRIRLKRQLRSCQGYYALVLRERIPRASRLYDDTLDGGIRGFWKLYPGLMDFFPHQVPITADYPVLLYPQGLEGLSFIRRYLDGYRWENRFCRLYSPARQRLLLEDYARRCGERPMELSCNLCEILLTYALLEQGEGLTVPERWEKLSVGFPDGLRAYLGRWCMENPATLEREMQAIREKG